MLSAKIFNEYKHCGMWRTNQGHSQQETVIDWSVAGSNVILSTNKSHYLQKVKKPGSRGSGGGGGSEWRPFN